jgi:hypothetical protein
MAKVNYNETATAGASKVVASAKASRKSFFFQAIGADMVLNFGDTATADNILLVPSGKFIHLTNREPFPIDKEITVFCAGANKFQAQAEE